MALQTLAAFFFYSLERNLTWLPPEQSNFPAKSAWIQAHPRLNQALMVGSGLGVLSLLPFLSWPSLILLGLAAGVALTYSLVPLPGGKPLKAFPLLKPLAIAFAWTSLTLGLPLLSGPLPAPAILAALLLFWVSGILANAMIFDLRDAAHDQAQGRVTLAIRLGSSPTRGLAWFCLGLQAWAGFWLGPALYPFFALVSGCGLVALLSLRLCRLPRPGFGFFLVADLSFCLPALLWPLA